MSAINDALRRASSAAKTSSPSPLPPMPVEPPRSEPVPPPVAEVPPPITEAPRGIATPPPLLRPQPVKKKSNLLLVLIILVVLGLVGAGGFYLWQKQSLVALAKDGSPSEAEEEITDNERLAALFGDERVATKIGGADIRTNSVSPTPSPAPRPNPPVSASRVPVTVTVAQPAPVPVVHPPVRFPPLRLQSIFYRPSSPSVIINGKTLFVTDEINGVIVADIQPASVTLVLGGQTNILTLR